MMELWIDGQPCDLDRTPTIPIDFDLARMKDVEGERSGRTVEVDLPPTPRNNKIFASSKDVYTLGRFNNEHHKATIKYDDVVIFEGTIYLLSTTLHKGNDTYKVRISEGGVEWIDSIVRGRLSDLEIPFSEKLNLSAITNSWEGDQAVRFLPIYREGKEAGYGSSMAPIERVMLTDDYHPFISVAEMVKTIFDKSGYKLRSRFFDSEFGRSLYMSGDYSRSDASAAKERCDFLARRAAPISAKADYIGRVYATQSVAVHSIGPIVDTADPQMVDSNGVQMRDTFNTLNAFSKTEAGDICFTPSRSVKAGFVLHLEYTTDYKILSRERLQGFDMVEGVNGVRVEFPLINTFEDHRNKIAAMWQYRVIVFDHTKGREYRLIATFADGSTLSMGEWNGRSTTVATDSVKPVSVELFYRDSSTATWMPYLEDWALYPGYIKEEGTIDVEMDFRLPPQDVAAGGRYLLDKFWFGGAAQGMSITVGTGTSLRPYFTTVPGYNSPLEFADITPRYIRQVDLLAALGRMFNLAFYTNRVLREVYIEPLEEFYSEGKEVDITEKIDYTYGVAISDAGLDMPQNHHFAYKEADGASHRFNLDNETTLGAWEYRNPLYGTKDSTREAGPQLFTTTLNQSDILAFAPSASLMQVGDVGNEEEGIDLGFTPRIACFKGLRQLPANECWIANRAYESYPYAAFLDKEGTNLCFEERNGTEGLSRYHLPELERLTNAQLVTLDLTLSTAEAVSLLTESCSAISVRNTYRIAIGDESSLYRLVKTEKWKPEKRSIRCTFERILKD